VGVGSSLESRYVPLIRSSSLWQTEGVLR
jgi:hypothetical protein